MYAPGLNDNMYTYWMRLRTTPLSIDNKSEDINWARVHRRSFSLKSNPLRVLP